MAIWILLVCALIYLISWVWLFSRMSTHTARVSVERPRDIYEKAI